MATPAGQIIKGRGTSRDFVTGFAVSGTWSGGLVLDGETSGLQGPLYALAMGSLTTVTEVVGNGNYVIPATGNYLGLRVKNGFTGTATVTFGSTDSRFCSVLGGP